MNKKLENNHEAAGSFSAEDIINPVALAHQLQSAHPFARHVFTLLSPGARDALAASARPGTDATILVGVLAKEFNRIAASGQTLYDAERVNGTKLRKSTRKLIKKNPRGTELERLNTLLVQDFFREELAHDSSVPVETRTEKGIKFHIYCEKRKLKTKWNISYKITFPVTGGSGSTHAPSLEKARQEIKDKLADNVLAGRPPVSKKEKKARDGKAVAYDAVAAEVAKVGRTDQKEVLEFITDAVKAQLKLGVDRPLLEFVLDAVERLVKPVTRCLLQAAASAFSVFILARKDVDKKENRRHKAVVKRFAAAILVPVRERKLKEPADGGASPEPPKDIFAEEIQTNDIQCWLNNLKANWKSRRNDLDHVRAFMAYCRDALHALPPNMKTAAHLVPRPKPDSDYKPEPATVLSFVDVWRILINIQDLETLFFFALAVFAGLHQSEIIRLDWENDLNWDEENPQIFIASGNGKNKHGNRMGAWVDMRYPLDKILRLGKGRTGSIVHRKHTCEDKLMPLIRRLRILWDESIMRHTYCSNLFGLGLTIEAVADQMRDTVAVMKRHYYAPIPKAVARRLWSLPMDIKLFEDLPIMKRFWDWHSALKQVHLSEQGAVRIAVEPASANSPVGGRRAVKKRVTPIAWPDDLELQVMLWEKSQAQIGRELNCAQTSVSAYALGRGLLPPKADYLLRLKHNLPVQIPEAVLKARQELLARKHGSAAIPGETAARSPSASTTTEDQTKAPAPGSEQPEPGNHNNQPEK